MGLTLVKYRYQATLHCLARIVTAVVGGYTLSNLVAIYLSYTLPGSQIGAVMAGMLLSFTVYLGVVLWVFSVKTLRTAVVGVVSVTGVFALCSWIFVPVGWL